MKFTLSLDSWTFSTKDQTDELRLEWMACFFQYRNVIYLSDCVPQGRNLNAVAQNFGICLVKMTLKALLYVWNWMWYGQAEDSNRVCAWGILENPHEHINCLRHHHGSQKGKLFHIWADRVRSVRLSDDTWLVRFDKWERSGELLYVLTFELRRNAAEFWEDVHMAFATCSNVFSE